MVDASFPLHMRTSCSVLTFFCCASSFTFSTTALNPSPSTSMQQDSYHLSWGGLHCCHRGKRQPGLSLTKASLEANTGETLTHLWGPMLMVRSRKKEAKWASFALWIWNLMTLHWETSLSPPHHYRSLSNRFSTERRTRSLLGGGSWWKYRPSGLSFFTALYWMTLLALNFVPGPSVDLALFIWKLSQVWEGGGKEKTKSHSSWGKSEMCIFSFVIFIWG